MGSGYWNQTIFWAQLTVYFGICKSLNFCVQCAFIIYLMPVVEGKGHLADICIIHMHISLNWGVALCEAHCTAEFGRQAVKMSTHDQCLLMLSNVNDQSQHGGCHK